jgi:hypothetical protein
MGGPERGVGLLASRAREAAEAVLTPAGGLRSGANVPHPEGFGMTEPLNARSQFAPDSR